jgi:DNA repair exonuclease SbcCD ATPase subunit
VFDHPGFGRRGLRYKRGRPLDCKYFSLNNQPIMNIDLRNIDDEFEKAVDAIKEIHDEKSNTKAVRTAVCAYMSLIDQLAEYRKRISSLRDDVDRLERDRDSITRAVAMIVNLGQKQISIDQENETQRKRKSEY